MCFVICNKNHEYLVIASHYFERIGPVQSSVIFKHTNACVTIGVFCVITNLFSIFGHFRFVWDSHTGAVFEDFEPLRVDFKTSDTQKAHPFAKPRLLNHHTSKSVANCGL